MRRMEFQIRPCVLPRGCFVFLVWLAGALAKRCLTGLCVTEHSPELISWTELRTTSDFSLDWIGNKDQLQVSEKERIQRR